MFSGPLLRFAVPVVVYAAEAKFATEWTRPPFPGWPGTVTLAIYLAIGPVALVWRQQHPLAVFAVNLGAALGSAVLFGESYLMFLPLLVALASVAARCPIRQATIAFGATLPVLGVLIVARVNVQLIDNPTSVTPENTVAFAVFDILIYAIAWLWGLQAQAHRTTVSELEEANRAAAEQERRRLARELHDIVSHAVSIMVLQAAGAQAVIAERPDDARTALTHIEASGRQAMSELRRLLTVLRADTSPAEADIDLRGLADLPDLLAQVRQPGTHVEVDVIGAPRVLDPSIDYATYRVVQEALTNAVKYAGTDATIQLQIEWGGNDLIVEITDHDGSPTTKPAPGLSTGFGLLGLNERVTMVGGVFEAGHGHDGQFRVRARLPLTDQHQPADPVR
jgi:signal transduction histidine kinase